MRNNSWENQKSKVTKSHFLYFVCNVSVPKHVLEDCETFKTFANERKRRVVDVGRYVNRIWLNHIV